MIGRLLGNTDMDQSKVIVIINWSECDLIIVLLFSAQTLSGIGGTRFNLSIVL